MHLILRIASRQACKHDSLPMRHLADVCMKVIFNDSEAFPKPSSVAEVLVKQVPKEFCRSNSPSWWIGLLISFVQEIESLAFTFLTSIQLKVFANSLKESCKHWSFSHGEDVGSRTSRLLQISTLCVNCKERTQRGLSAFNYICKYGPKILNNQVWLTLRWKMSTNWVSVEVCHVSSSLDPTTWL